jgi:hypothetical protein
MPAVADSRAASIGEGGTPETGLAAELDLDRVAYEPDRDLPPNVAAAGEEGDGSPATADTGEERSMAEDSDSGARVRSLRSLNMIVYRASAHKAR